MKSAGWFVAIVAVLLSTVGFVWYDGGAPSKAPRAKTASTSKSAPSKAKTSYSKSSSKKASVAKTTSTRPTASSTSSASSEGESKPADSVAQADEVAPQAVEIVAAVPEVAATVSAPAPASDPEPLEIEPVRSQVEPEREPLVSFVLHDDAGEPLNDALLVARWREDGTLREAIAEPSADGAFAFEGPLGEQVVFEARAPGRAPTVAGPLGPSQFSGAKFGLALERGGTIAGRVRGSSDKPRANFRVVVWPTDNQVLATSYAFEKSDDGAFSIDGVWRGPLTLLAISSDGACSAPIACDAESAAEVELVVEAPVAIKGRVIGVDGRPLAGARVEALAAVDGFGVATLSSVKTDSKGRFTLRKGSAGGIVTVYADGLAPRSVACAPGDDGACELGDVELETRRALRVELVGIAGDASGWTLTGWGVEALPTFAFDSAGVASLEGLAPGRYCCALSGPNGESHDFEYTLTAESNGELEIRVR